MSRALPGARFSDPAWLYDLVYQFKDYPAEAEQVAQLLMEHGVPEGASVLEAACGTGLYMAPLAKRFAVSGFDLDPAMLAVARGRLPPGTPLYKADLADFAPPDSEPVRALLLLFGCIGYVAPERLSDCVGKLRDALEPGGVLLLEPWVAPDRFEAQVPFMLTYETRFLKVCRQCVPIREGDLSVLEFHFLVSRPGFAPEHIIERNELWLHDHEALAQALRDGGFSVRVTERGFMQDKVLMECVRL